MLSLQAAPAPSGLRGSGLTVLLLMALGGPVLSGCTRSAATKMTSDAWRADLRYLAKALPAKHGDAFNQISRGDFETAVESLEGRIPSLEDHQVAAELGRIVAMIGDGHTELWLPQKAVGFRRLPLGLHYFGEDLYVFAATEQYESAIGGRVTAIGGTPIRDAYAKVVPLIARDNEYEYLLSAPIYLVVPEILHAAGIIQNMEEVTLTLAGPEGESLLSVRPGENLADAVWKTALELDGLEPPLYQRRREAYYWFEYLEESRTLYLQYNRCRNQPDEPSIRRFASKLFDFVDRHPIDRFVFDLRHNTGGNMHRNRPLIEGVRDHPKINRRGRLFVLTSRTTFSAGTNAAIALKRQTEALIVGEPSRGKPNGYADVELLRLPNSGIEVNYAPKYREDMPELGDAPFLPVDLPVTLTFDDYRRGRDPVLEQAISWRAG